MSQNIKVVALYRYVRYQIISIGSVNTLSTHKYKVYETVLSRYTTLIGEKYVKIVKIRTPEVALRLKQSKNLEPLAYR